MPEGPSILFLAKSLYKFEGKKVKTAGGYGPMDTDWLKGQTLLHVKTWGKHLLFQFKKATVKVHLGLFGDVLIDEEKKVNRSFFMCFANGCINGYVVKASKIEEPLNEVYDWRTDALHKHFDAKYVKQLLLAKPEKQIHEVLMDQDIFTGTGNKIRNEALYRACIHPHSIVGKIPPAAITKLVAEVKKYAGIFLKDLETKGLNDSFKVYQQEFAADGSEVTVEVLKKEKRKIFYSEHHQKLYS